MPNTDISKLLTAPFAVEDISWKINNIMTTQRGTFAMITYHIDARAVQKRLNDALGIFGWSFKFEEANGFVHGKLEISNCIREDVGYPNSELSKEPMKDAVSDALKRCAVHFGIGHFLYGMDSFFISVEQGAKRLTKEQDLECKQHLESYIDSLLTERSLES